MDKINESQAGFRQGYTTIDNMFILQSEYLNIKGGKFYALFVDCSKAFDSVQRHKLWNLFNIGGLSSKMSNVYENVKACVRNNCELSETLDIQIGVRQGCVLSPFFSLIHK